jgi:outer membrane scaffolding protein for murein synthesis (MipA/OmpV family)
MRIMSTILLALAVPLRLLAQEPAAGRGQDSQFTAPDWSVSVGAMAFAYPRYPGSDEHRVVPFPLVNASFRDRVYLGPSSTGIGFARRLPDPHLACPARGRGRWAGQPSVVARGCARGDGEP